ncbi:MAG: hypothetical protein JRE28_15265 [Deltaproteobacteria bacterium]|nr:hypothetical protein [Deltaproteobacteria bacterium]
MDEGAKYSVSINFEGIKLPPFEDILLLGRRCPHGKIGIAKCLDLLSPEGFELVELDDETVQSMLVSKRILKRMPIEKIIDILKEKVFPFILNGEIVKVNFNVKIHFDNIEGLME